MSTINLLPILSCEQIQKLDSYTIENIGIPQAALMEEAAERVFAAMCNDFPQIVTGKVLVLSGSGNNGADSLCIARKLFLAAADVCVCIVNDKGSDLFIRHLNVCRNLGMNIKKVNEELSDNAFDFVIDGIFGVGYKFNPNRPFPLPEKLREIAKAAVVLAVDLPSGLSEGGNSILKADVTYSIGFPKSIFYNAKSRPFCGKIRNIEISFDKKQAAGSYNLAVSMNNETVRKSAFVNKRSDFVHKYKRGSCLILGGSPGKNGAVGFCSAAAFAAGCGITAILTGKSNFPDVSAVKKEAVYDVMENISSYKHYSCTVVGPGLGALSEDEKSLIISFIKDYEGQLIFDASFFTVFEPDLLKYCKNKPLLTPHSGEFKKFFGQTEISITKATEIAKQHNCFLLLKDSFMIFAEPNDSATVFDFPMRIAAQAGSGDLLAGYIAGNILQTDDLRNAVSISVMRFYNELKKFDDRNCYLPEELISNLSLSVSLSDSSEHKKLI